MKINEFDPLIKVGLFFQFTLKKLFRVFEKR